MLIPSDFRPSGEGIRRLIQQQGFQSLPKRTTKDGRLPDNPGQRSRLSATFPDPSPNQDFQLSEALSALDLDNLDLSSIDPSLATSLLEEIRLGADLGPILDKIRTANAHHKKNTIKETKVVTFQDETKSWFS